MSTYKIEKKDSLHIEKELYITENLLKSNIDKILDDLIFQVRLDGFRPLKHSDLHSKDSKVQNAVLKRKDMVLNRNKAYIIQEAKQVFLNDYISKELSTKDNVLNIATKFENDRLTLTYDLYENLKVSSLNDVEITNYSLEDLNKEVEIKLAELASNLVEVQDKDGAITKGDVIKVQIHFINTHPDKENEKVMTLMFSEFETEFYDEKDILGKKTHDKFVKNLKITKALKEKHEFLKEFKTLEMQFEITAVQTKTTHEFNDENVAKFFNIDSKDKLEKLIRSNILEEFNMYNAYYNEYQLVSNLHVNADVSSNIFQKEKEEVIRLTLNDKRKIKTDALVENRVKSHIILNHFRNEYKTKLENNDIVQFLLQSKSKELIEKYQQNDETKNKINEHILNKKVLTTILSKVNKIEKHILLADLKKIVENLEDSYKL